jgi:GTP-binding protein EngB required for normal cell division
MPVRLLVAAAILLAIFLVLFLVLLATDTALSVWHYLRDAPPWAQLAYAVVLTALPLFTVILFWNWFRPGRKKSRKAEPKRLTAESLQDELLESSRMGVDVSQALEEIREQRRRAGGGEIYIAVYGEISSGKSSLVQALVPEIELETDPRAGTTTVICHYSWQAPSGDRIVFADLPGFNLADDSAAIEETRRAHLVIFLCDSDLTGSEMAQLNYLRQLDKPLILALNKADQYTPTELEAFRNRFRERTGLEKSQIVTISTGGREEVIRMLGEDIEQRTDRVRKPEIAALRSAVQRVLDQDRELVESLRETAVLTLASEKLDAARNRRRDELAGELVNRYSRRAVIGALAAVAPGSDLVIQGVLATQLMRELSGLYDVPVKEMEIESFLKLASGKVRNMTAITLAIAGNALKAFPGLGTVSGGLIHAVAYGMIFDSLGKAAAQTLSSRGALRPLPAAKAFEDLLNDQLETGAVRFAKMAITGKQPGKKPD